MKGMVEEDPTGIRVPSFGWFVCVVQSSTFPFPISYHYHHMPRSGELSHCPMAFSHYISLRNYRPAFQVPPPVTHSKKKTQ